MKQLNFSTTLFLCFLTLIGCTKQSKEEAVLPVNVKVAKMESISISDQQKFAGTIEEMSGSELSFSVGGTVKKIMASQGQKVEEGELIAILDDATLQSNYSISAATLSQAEDAYQRMKTLYDNNSLPEIKWIEIQSQYKQALAAEQIGKKALNDSKLYAPFSGIIATKSIEAGQNVMPGVPVVKLVKTTSVKVKISVPENEIANIKEGQSVLMKVSALNDKSFVGRIIEKGITANPLSRSYEVKAIIDNKKGELMPGMICQIYLDRESEASTFVLPARNIQINEKNDAFVWINKQGVAQKQYIKLGATTNKGVVIEEGLNNGDEVIVEGSQKISEGSLINIIK